MPVVISQNMDLAVNNADLTYSVFSENMGRPEPIEIIIIKVF